MPLQLHFREIGQGQGVMILHGLFGMNDNWQSFAKDLAVAGFRVVLVDLRNHGHSPHADDHNYRVMAEDVSALIDKLELESLTLIGHSMGGKVAMTLANQRPDQIKKLIVIDIAPWAYAPQHDGIIEALQSVQVETLQSRSEAEAQLKGKIKEESTRQFLLKNLHRNKEQHFEWRFNLEALSRHIAEVAKPTWPEYPLRLPVLFISGTQSNYVDPEREHEIIDHFPNAGFVSIAGAGHWVHADQPAALLDVVVEFCKS